MLRLSIALGIDIEEIEQWDVEKIQRYYAYYLLEPFGNEWYQTAQTCNLMANLHGRGKGAPPYRIEQWLPIKVEQTADEMLQNLLGSFGGR